MNKNLKMEHPKLDKIRCIIKGGHYLSARDRICMFLKTEYKAEPDNKKKLATLQYIYLELKYKFSQNSKDRDFYKEIAAPLDQMLIELINDIMGAQAFNMLELLNEEKK